MWALRLLWPLGYFQPEGSEGLSGGDRFGVGNGWFWLVFNTFLSGSLDSMLVMCTCIGVGIFSTLTSGVVVPE